MKIFRFVSALTLLGLAVWLFAGCDRGDASAKPADVDYYTCTMHPSVKAQNPKDKYPICSIDLVPVQKQNAKPAASAGAGGAHGAHAQHGGQAGGAMPPAAGATGGESGPREFTVPLDRQQMIGVTYATIEQRPLNTAIRAVGTVAADKLRHWDYVSRVEAYVQRLAVASRGEAVRKGQPLVTLYSPDFLATQRDFIDALRIRDEAHKSSVPESVTSADRLVAAARRRLLLWNLDDRQLDELEKTREAADTLSLHSPFDGIVLDLAVNQGARVMPGDHLVDVADLSVVWVWAEFYQEELSLLQPGLPVVITTSAYPNEKLNGKIALVDPFLDNLKRTGRVRIDVENPELKLRPDMYVDVELQLDMGEGLTVPFGAVMPTGKRNIVFVDKGEGRLEPRLVELGRKYGDVFEVRGGLTEDERVVASGNFLIDAEAKVQGALQSWR